MGIFTDIEMVWAGKTYTIKSHRMMGALAQVEQFVTGTELALFGQRQTIPLVRMCQAYAAVLKYAGARVSEEDIYQAVHEDQLKQLIMFKQIMIFLALGRPKDQREAIYGIIAGLERKIDGDEGGDDDPDAPDANGPAMIEDPAGNADAASAAS